MMGQGGRSVVGGCVRVCVCVCVCVCPMQGQTRKRRTLESAVLQGLVLDCSPLEWVSLDVMPPPPELVPDKLPRWPVWLALDEVTDPVSVTACFASSLSCASGRILALLRGPCRQAQLSPSPGRPECST